MNRHIARAALASMTLSAALAVHAQSSVQVYGRVDVGVDYQTVAHKPRQVSVTSDNSRLGFRGTEDLGDGLRAGFLLEEGLNVDTGAIGGFAGSGGPVPFTTGQLGQAGSGGFNAGSSGGFSRQSIVYLGSPTMGEVHLGRDNTPSFLVYFVFDPFSGQNHGNTQDLFKAIVRASNSATYESPRFANVTLRLQAAASEGSGGRFWNGSATYDNGPLRAAVAYQTLNTAGLTAFNPALTRFSNVILGGAYAVGNGLTLRAGFQSNKLDTVTGSSPTVRVWLLGGNYSFGVSEIKFAYQRLTNSVVSDAGAKKLAAAYFYNFSKRTSVYLSVGDLDNGPLSATRLSPSVLPVAAGDHIRSAMLGLRHDF